MSELDHQSELELQEEVEPLADEVKLRESQERIEATVVSGALDTIQEKVAWILNAYPDARDSDIRLQILYWEHFVDNYNGSLDAEDLFHLPRLTSLARARAKIQNTYKLFQASDDVRRVRGKLSGDERERARAQQPLLRSFLVYADESGKTHEHLIVGSVWFLHAPETIKMQRELALLLESYKFAAELHFKEIDDRTLPVYIEAANLATSQANTVSFKVISHPRKGLGKIGPALDKLYYHLIVEGIAHENETGRAPLPRALQLIKDLENEANDRLFFAEMKDRLRATSAARFNGDLHLEKFWALDSKDQILLQLADLFTSSVNRVLNVPNNGNAKDRFARHFLAKLEMPDGYRSVDREGDLVFHVAL